MSLSPIFPQMESANGELRVSEHDALKISDAEIAAQVLPVKYAFGQGDLRRFGCDVKGNTDSTEQIENAVAAAMAPGGCGYIYHPGGEIVFAGTISVPNGLTVFGFDRTACQFSYTANGDAFKNENAIDSSGFGRVAFRCVKILGNDTTNTGAGVNLLTGGFSYYIVDDCYIVGFKYPLVLDQAEIVHVRRNILSSSISGARILWITNGNDWRGSGAAGYSNVITVRDNQIDGGQYGIVDDGGNLHIIEGNNFNGQSIPARFAAVQSLKLSGNSFETQLQTGNANVLLSSLGVDGATKGPCTNGRIQGNTFAGNMAASSACLRFVGDWHTGFNVASNTFFSLFGRGSAIDVDKLGNSYCGQNIDLGTGSMSHYNAPHQDGHGNILLPPQMGAAVLDATYPYEFGDTRAPIKPYGGLDFDTQGGLEFNLHKFQQFTIEIKNNGGTLQHRIITSHLDTATTPSANLIQCISGASATYHNIPTVSSGTGFGGLGAGITSTAIYFDTSAQTRASNWSMAVVEYYDGNVQRARAAVGFDSININGTTRQRLAIFLTDDMTGAAVAVNTTLLPSGKTIAIKVFAGVAA